MSQVDGSAIRGADADQRQDDVRGSAAGRLLTTEIEWEVAMSTNGSPPFPPFAVTVVRDGVEVAVAPQGELDLASAGALTQAVHQAWAAGSEGVTIDLRPLEFIDSCGLRALLALREAAARDGRDLALRPGPSVVQRIFELTGTRDLFRWHPGKAPAASDSRPA